ncbi:MAG: response regulator transcription factor [Acidimicrobiales bacterium]
MPVLSAQQQADPAQAGNGARIWVVEDDGLIRHSLEASLGAEGYDIRADADACAVGEVVGSFRPDLAILDVRLPVGPDGWATARVLREASDLAVLFLTAADSIEERLAGFDAGCDDYVVKPFSMAELQVRIRALLRRMGRAGSPVRRVGDVTLDEALQVVTRAGQEVELTGKEFDLLATLMGRPGEVISKLQLLAEVWRFEGFDANLVEVNVSSLRRKLEAHGPRVLHTVWGVGYTWRA